MSDKRDAKLDMEIIFKTTPGPWTLSRIKDGSYAVDGERWDEFAVVYGNDDIQFAKQGLYNAEFIAMSREALPYWINRAITAEQLLRDIAPFANRLPEELEKRVNEVTRNG